MSPPARKAVVLICMQQSENFRNQKRVGHYQGIITQDHTILLKSKLHLILEIYQKPTGATDAIAMQHDVDYDACSNREKNMVKISKNVNIKWTKKW